jgi:acetyltransferase-like isoleucine patch superfamily enzyme
MIQYLKTIFSLDRFFSKRVSFYAIWDSKSSFTKYSEIRRFSKLKNSVIGKYSRVNPGCKLANTTVGNFTAIGRDTTIGLGQHPLNYISTQNIFYKKNKLNNNWAQHIDFSSKPIMIGNDVWIGVESLIMDGVKIGDGAVIGARSVVTKDVPPYAIVVGQPAKIIKYRFENDVIERLLEIKWWNFSDEEISDKIYFFREPIVTIEIINEYFPI